MGKPDKNILKEVFAWFGAATYAAQCFEFELCTLLILFHMLDNGYCKCTKKELAKLDGDLSAMTMGKLLKKLRTRLKLFHEGRLEHIFKSPDDYLDIRNKLMHGFFTRHAENFSTPEGCQVMIEELKVRYNKLFVAHDTAREISRNIKQRLGFPEETLQELVQTELSHLSD